MDTEASTTASTADASKNNGSEPVKIKTEVFDPGYKSANDAFNATAQILTSAIKSEDEIKKEIKEEPMDTSGGGNQNHITKMPLPILEILPKEEKQKNKPCPKSNSNQAQMRILAKKAKKGKNKRTLIHEAGKQQRTTVFQRAPANNSGYYPPASVIWQRVPYLKPKRTKTNPKYNPYKWKSPKNRPNRVMGQESPQSNMDHSMNQSYHDNENSPSDDNVNENPPSNSTENSNTSCYFLNVSEFPINWNEEQMKEFLEKECGPLIKNFEMLKDVEMNFIGDVQIWFDSFEDRKEAQKKFNGKIVEGKTLLAEVNDSSDDDSDNDSEYSEPSIKRSKLKLEAAYRPDIDVWEKDPKGLYGLKPEFLQSLGISPPIDRWVQVTNFRCDKSELKEVLELAGQVLLCTVLTMNHKIAKVMYSHPLEAVQAVSMLNNQAFYGQSLKVTMEHCLDRQIVLPKGLQAVGPGLGQNGTTLRDIVRHYERYAKGQSSSINSRIFHDVNFKMDASDQSPFTDIGSMQTKTEAKAESSQNIGPFVPNPCNPIVNQNRLNVGLSETVPEPSAPMAGPSGHMPGTSSPIPGLGVSMPPSRGPMTRPSGPGPVTCLNGPRPVNGAPLPNQMRPNVPGPMHYQTGPIPVQNRPGFCPNPMPMPMMGQGSRIPRQTGPMHGPMGPIPGQFQKPCPPGTGPLQNQSTWYPNQPLPPGSGCSMPGHRPPGPMGPAGPNQGPLRPVNNAPAMTMSNCPGPIPQSQENCTVEISNIPSNTTFTFLADKLSTCGRMMSLQLTCDRAVAQFATRGHAENCYKQFNKLKVCDNILQVKFI